MYMFIFFVVSIVQNIFMVIVEDAYISIKYAKNFEWLNSGVPHPESDPSRDPNFGGGGGQGGNPSQPFPPN